MRREFADGRVKFHVGDVRDPRSVEDAMDGVAHVFHAAALKQVPSCEFFPQQAVLTNVKGSDNVIRAAERAGVRVRGVPEHRQGGLPDQRHGHLQGDDGEGGPGPRPQPGRAAPTVSITRYGNVMYSRGSVIPVFVEQLRAGQAAHHDRPGR